MRSADDEDGGRLPLVVVQFVRFIGVGSLATLAHVGMALLANLLGAAPLAANTIGFLCSATVSYLGNFYWTFASASEHRQSIGRFAAMCALAFSLTTAIAYVVQSVLAWPFAVALLLMIATVPPMNFLLGRLWVFRPSARAG
jgi:putative flippase GtrA